MRPGETNKDRRECLESTSRSRACSRQSYARKWQERLSEEVDMEYEAHEVSEVAANRRGAIDDDGLQVNHPRQIIRKVSGSPFEKANR